MASRTSAFVNHEILAWARSEAGYTVDQAADAIGMPAAKLAAWEKNEAQPTLRQAEALAKVYDLSFSIFSLPEPPKTVPVSAEHRRLPGIKAGAESPQLRKALRRLARRRRLALFLADELGDRLPDFNLSCRLDERPDEVAFRFREALGISIESQLKWPSEFVAFRAWRAAVEELGALVCQFSGKDLTETRGAAIVQFPLPVVAISSKEIPLSKPFTLLHEVTHLALAAANQEAPAASDDRPESEWLKVERYCESVAAGVLMPEPSIRDDADLHLAVQGDNVDAVRRMARRYKVTPTAVATRLLWLQMMPHKRYNHWKSLWESYCAAHPSKPGFGIATPAEKAVTRAGPYFTSLVLSALSHDRISGPDASNYLGVSFEHVNLLREGWIAKPAGLAGVNMT